MKSKIERTELIDFKNMHVDTMGKIYRYGDRYIRIIQTQKEELCKELFATGCVSELIEKGYLVETKISNFYLQNEDEVILEHLALQEIVKPHRWSYDMIKDAGMLIISINEILYQYGYELNDCCIGNICFDGARPVLVDFGCIDYYNHNWNWLRIGFFDNYVYPLKMMDAGFESLVSAAFLETELGNLGFDNMRHIYYGVERKKITDQRLNLIRRIQFLICKYSDQTLLQQDKKLLCTFNYCSPNTVWGRYQDNMWGGGGVHDLKHI